MCIYVIHYYIPTHLYIHTVYTILLLLYCFVISPYVAVVIKAGIYNQQHTY